MNLTKQLFYKPRRTEIKTHPAAFTLLDLVTILAVLFVLGSVLASGLARTRPTGQSIQCMTNVRRLANAWQMYAQDNNDKLVIAYQGGDAMGGNYDPLFGPGWAAGWLDWTTSSDNTNVSFLVGRYASFSAYFSDPSVFQCPVDTFVSSVQRSRGWTRRARSYSMDIALGDGNAERSGPWNTFYAHVKKMSEMRFPSPAETWVFIEEHPDSINDPAFMLPNQGSWLDYPARFHNGNTSLSFADGHVESHTWQGAFASDRGAVVHYNFDFGMVVGNTDPDIHWMSYHSQRATSASY